MTSEYSITILDEDGKLIRTETFDSEDEYAFDLADYYADRYYTVKESDNHTTIRKSVPIYYGDEDE